MKRILPLLTCLIGLFSTTTNAQWNPITHTTGTQTISGVGVTVTNNNGTLGGGCGGQFWVQQTNASYTFTFAPAVAAVWITVDAINTGESIEFIINGAQFPVTNCNLDPNPFVNNCSVGNCNIVNGQFVNNTAFWVCGGVMIFYGPITSFTILEPIGGSGTTFDISFVPPGGTIPGGNGAGVVTAGSNSPVCAGNPLNLTATVTGSPYSWTGPGGFTSNQQNPTINPANPAQSGDYIVTSVTPCGTAKDTVTVVVNPAPVITNSFKTDPTTCGGNNGTMVFEGLAPNTSYTVDYLVNGNPVSVVVNSNGTGVLTVTGLTQGSYTNITVTAAPCPAISVGNMLLVDPPIPAAPTASSNSPVCENSTINFQTTPVTGGTFNWTGPLGFASGQPNPSIPNAPLGAEGNYSVTVTVANCVSAPTIVFVDMTPQPLPPVTAPTEFCQLSPAVPLTATGTALLWYTSLTGTGSAVAPTPSTTTAGPQTFYVTQTVSGCESNKAPLIVNIKPKPLPPLYTGPVHYCAGDPSVALTANGTSLQWYDAQNNPLPGAPTVVTTVAADFVWYVDQTVNGCVSDRTTVAVHVAAIPPPPGVADVKQCQYDAQIPLTAVGTDLRWYNDATGGSPLINVPLPATDAPMTRTWYVSQTIDGCESPRAPILVTIDFLPTSTFGVSRPLVCENDTLSFWYTGNAGPSEIYTWTLPADSAELISGTTDISGPIVIRFDSVGTFPLTLTVNNLGCITSTTYNVKVVNIPEVTISMPADVCIHDSVKVGLGNYNSYIASLDWDFGGGVNVLNNVDEGPYLIQWSNEGVKRVQVVAGNTACETTTFDTVIVHSAPDAHFSAVSGGGQLCIGDSVRLAANDNNALYSYEWAPERFFNHSNNFAPVVNAYVAAAQEITLTVTTPYGCSATESMMMNAEECCVVSLPNVFTPNGDGRNDIFRPITVGTHAMKVFMVVNRWGQKVFETINESEGWDGTFNGADQNVDTYFYILQYKCNGKMQEKKGEVILMR